MSKAFFALLILSGGLEAQDSIETLAATEPGNTEKYLELRNTFSLEALPELREASAPEKWTRETWVKALAAEAVRLRIEDPDLATTIDRPRGLNPEVYKTFRKPTPLCLREFRHIGKRGIPLLLERWRWTLEEHPFSEGEAGTKERDVFRQAILAAAGQTADKRARFFLEEILLDSAEDKRWRSEAAISLGMCAGEEALPTILAILDGPSPIEVQQACARALGRIPTLPAFHAIETRLGKDQMNRSLITALGLLGSKWGWKSRGKEAGSEIRKRCADLLVQQINHRPELEELIGRALCLVAWPESLDQIERMSDNPAARAILPLLRRTLER